MKYYVSYTEEKDGNILTTMTGNRIKRGSDIRRFAFFMNHEMPEESLALPEMEIIEKLFNAPMTKIQATRLMNRLKKNTHLKGEFRIREYTEEVSLYQFAAFIRW